MKKIFALAGAMLILTILLTGCTSQPVTTVPATNAGPTEVPAVTPAGAGAPGSSSFPTGVNWRLFSYTDGKGGMSNIVGDQPITALFRADGTVTGSSGCNQYTAAYTTTGSSIKITPGISTMMACSPAVMDQESLYFSLMAGATTYSVNGDTLLFFDNTGKATLGYKKPLDTPVTLSTQSPVIGTWDLLTYNNGNNAMVSVLLGSNISAVFTADGKMAGSSGCNEYSGLYTLHGTTLGITQVKSTKMACEPDTMTQENQYLALLPKVSTYEMNGDQMVLYTMLGEKILQYKKSQAATITATPKSTPLVSPRTLVGTWVLKSYTDGKGGAVPVLSVAPVNAKFQQDGSLIGSSGCNQYSTTYSTSGESISISQAASTRMACEPAVMAQETAYLTLLPKAGKFVIFGDSMTLYDTTGAVLLSYSAP
jgi:heat shock protein HslJ